MRDVFAEDAQIQLHVIRRDEHRGNRVDIDFARNRIAQECTALQANSVLSSAGGYEDFCAWTAAGAVDEPAVEFKVPSCEMTYLISVGNQAPNWWTDWSLIRDWLGEDIWLALQRGAPELWEEPPDEAVVAGLAAAHEITIAVWNHLRDDLASVFDDQIDPQELSSVAGRWMNREIPESAPEGLVQLILLGLARNPRAPQDVLVRLSQSSDAGISWMVQRNPVWQTARGLSEFDDPEECLDGQDACEVLKSYGLWARATACSAADLAGVLPPELQAFALDHARVDSGALWSMTAPADEFDHPALTAFLEQNLFGSYRAYGYVTEWETY